jgi:hypothetical protein
VVKLRDPQLAKRYGIKTFPALVYFRNGKPLTYDGEIYERWMVVKDLYRVSSLRLMGDISDRGESLLGPENRRKLLLQIAERG